MIRKMLDNKKLVSFIIILIMVISCILLSNLIENNYNSRIHQHQQEVQSKPTEFDINEDNIISDSFSTHLPLVVIDTYGQETKSGVKWDKDKGYYAPLNIDPFINGNISIIDNEDNVNSIKDAPSIESEIKIKQRGNTSTSFPKKQYAIKTIDKDGKKSYHDILGMGQEWEWVLNISYIDKTLLRNYMTYNISGKIMPYTPDLRYCEVVMKNGNNYTYEGVYLFIESIKTGKDRINISEYDDKFTHSSYLLRRDRFEENALLLDNYSTRNGYPVGYLEVKYPKKDEITKRTIDYITKDIDKFEEAIYSKDIDYFYKYRDYIDLDSFIDYFIINEFFANYDAGYHSTYIYKENGDKIKMGPVWDFDMSLDNDIKEEHKLKIDSTAMHDAPWYRQLLRDSNFTDKIINRYNELRKDVLNEENLLNYIDDTIKFLGPAIDRDRDRWEYEGTYRVEVEKMKSVIINHGRWLDENIDSLYQFSEYDESNTEKNLLKKAEEFILGSDKRTMTISILSIVFIGIFITSIILVQKD